MTKISQAELKSLVATILRKKVEHIEQAQGGEVNQVFIIDTGSERIVARINHSSELARFRKEEWCIDQSTQSGVIGPRVLATGVEDPWAYIFETFLPGMIGSSTSLNHAQLWRAVGEFARSIHSINVSGFGENLLNITSGTHGDWQKYLADNCACLKEGTLLSEGFVTQGQSENMLTWFKELAAENFDFGLSHGDLSLNNVIVSEEGQVSLIDWGSAEAHLVPHYDFGVILSDSLSDEAAEFGQVLQGYGMTRDEYSLIKPKVLSLMLLITVDKLRWALDKKPDKVNHYVEELKSRFIKKQAG